jgi:N-acetylneuraminate epimerase
MIKHALFVFMLVVAGITKAQPVPQKKPMFHWDSLTSIPDTIGFAGSFAGTTDDVLIVAGGSNFPHGGTPWNGGIKTWYDKIFILEKPTDQWKEAGRLPFALGYGVSISTPQGLILIGGSNEKGHYGNVFRLRYKKGKIETDTLPSLPFALANFCGALAGNKIFVAGGITTPASTTTENAFLCFDLKKKNAGWQRLPTWPGPSRMFGVAASDGKSFFLFSGGELENGSRVYLRDAYAFNQKDGWKQLADLPHATVAAPSLAFFDNAQAFYIFGGDTGKDAKQAAVLREKHPGFSNAILKYNIVQNKWTVAGEINGIPPVTTSLVSWKNKIILPGGEIRPGTRTSQVLAAELHEE